MEPTQIPQIPTEQPIIAPPTPITTQPVTPTYLPVEHKSNNLPIFILSVLLVISLAGIAYLYTQIQSLKTQAPTPTPMAQIIPSPVATPAATPTPAASSAADPTASWKTYSNKALGFEVKYPPTVKIDKEMNDQYNKATMFKGGNLDFQISLRTGKDIADIVLDKYYYMDNPDFTKSTLSGKVANIYTQDMSKNDCVSDGTGPGCPLSYVVYVAMNNNSLYHVGFYGDATLSDTEKLILASFKFTN
jgi:hypothetical protein